MMKLFGVIIIFTIKIDFLLCLPDNFSFELTKDIITVLIVK